MELKRIKTIWQILKTLVAYPIAFLFKSREIWLVSEKRNEARDNGYWFYRYLRENHPQIDAYYVITKDSADLSKIRALGANHIVWSDSFRHLIYYWAATYSVSSQPFGSHPFDYFQVIRRVQFLKRKQQKTVFLQHGITKDELPHALDFPTAKMDLFCTSAKKEQNAVCQVHHYPEKMVPLTGLCRYDRLPLGRNTLSRQILVMPTFRHWLMARDEAGIPTEAEKMRFSDDMYFKAYASLLSSGALIRMLQKFQYTLVFYPHFSAQCYLPLFEGTVTSDRIILADRKNYDVQQLLIDSDILVTDYSSVFFDFAYMKKPEIFYQFDETRYRGSHYKEGYFVYRRDAFGPVVTDENSLLELLEKLLKNDAKMSKQDEKKVEEFFAFTDNKNCERTFQAIMELK